MQLKSYQNFYFDMVSFCIIILNMFLRQVVLQNGIPFEVKYPEYKPEVIEAMEEANRISRDPNVKGYTDIDELFEELNS